MARICLVSCVSSKRERPAPARDLYTSPLFQGARRLAETRFDRWYILSAKYGLVEPTKVIAPYEKTLKNMPKKERLSWASMVFDSLQNKIQSDDQVGFVAGADYREFLNSMLCRQGIHAQVPLEGMSIGIQLAWFKKFQEETERLNHLDTFYNLLGKLENGLESKRRMRECTGNMPWPKMGVYFFFEAGEYRTTSVGTNRVVRVGTHTVSKGSKTTLWHRLRTHRGAEDLSGNHRGSIFRLHVGAALLAKSRDTASVSTWAQGQSAPREVREGEAALERKVSQYIGDMSLLWLAVGDEPSPTSDRSYLERNSIALLAGATGPIDLPSPRWLGRHSPREPIRSSGLWNVNHVEDSYDPRFLTTMADYVDITLNRRPQPKHSIAPRGWHLAKVAPNRDQLLLFKSD